MMCPHHLHIDAFKKHCGQGKTSVNCFSRKHMFYCVVFIFAVYVLCIVTGMPWM